ncbi:MAG: ATP-binding protein, partial [Planctomycetia bacterium]
TACSTSVVFPTCRGPVGKTTLVEQAVADVDRPSLTVSADEPTLRDTAWLSAQWERARLLAREHANTANLVIDEVQKVSGWSETVKWHWDEDTRRGIDLRVVLLGSAPLLIRRGLSESLAGRFETVPLPHWSFAEMRAAFAFTLEDYLFFGGYPGAAALVGDLERWRRYVLDALVETTVGRDILLMSRVDMPALLRRLFELGCRSSGQILSYTKMLGQLHDAGNTVTLAHYLDLLSGAGMLTGLQKYATHPARRRGSSPKLQVFNTALLSAVSDARPADRRRCVGAGEAHPLPGEGLEPRCLEQLALRPGDVGRHRHRQAVPALVVGEHEDDVRLTRRRR